MSWLARLGLLATGLLLIVMSLTQLGTGHAFFLNESYRQPTFAAGGIGIGFVFLLLACLPPASWLYPRISTRKPPIAFQHLQRRKRPSRLSRRRG